MEINKNFYLTNLVDITRKLYVKDYEEFMILYEENKDLVEVEIKPHFLDLERSLSCEFPHYKQEEIMEEIRKWDGYSEKIYTTFDNMNDEFINKNVKDTFDWDGLFQYSNHTFYRDSIIEMLENVMDGDNVYR